MVVEFVCGITTDIPACRFPNIADSKHTGLSSYTLQVTDVSLTRTYSFSKRIVRMRMVIANDSRPIWNIHLINIKLSFLVRSSWICSTKCAGFIILKN